MGFPSDQTNFDHTFGGRVTFYKPIDAEDIVAKTVTIVGRTDSVSLTVKDSSSLSTLSVSNQSTFKNIVVTGIATVNNLNLDGELRDGDGHFGSAGQVLSSDGTDTKWINTSSANVGSASNVGTNEDATNAEQYVTFVGNKSGNNPIRVDEGIKYNPSTNVLTVGTISATTFTGLPAGFPSGGIIMWSGATVPRGWALCDGTLSTPDLRDRFIVGAGSGGSYTIGDTGGSDSVTLTVDQIPAHTHTAYTDGTGTPPGGVAKSSGNGDTVNTGSTGGGQSHENRPPYYALAFIMKL